MPLSSRTIRCPDPEPVQPCLPRLVNYFQFGRCPSEWFSALGHRLPRERTGPVGHRSGDPRGLLLHLIGEFLPHLGALPGQVSDDCAAMER